MSKRSRVDQSGQFPMLILISARWYDKPAILVAVKTSPRFWVSQVYPYPCTNSPVVSMSVPSRTGLRNRFLLRIFRARCTTVRNGTDDLPARRKALVGVAQRITDRTHSGAQTEDERVQDPYPEPYHGFSPILLRRTDRDRRKTARTSGSWSTPTLSACGRRSEQVSRRGRGVAPPLFD